jgi:DNA-binding beta-propeller fold protein YncE
MLRPRLLPALALLAAGCGARSDLGAPSTNTAGTTGPHTEHIYVTDSHLGGDTRIVRFDDIAGSNWTTYRPAVSAPCPLAVDAAERIYFGTFTPPSITRIDDMLGNGLVAYDDAGLDDGQLAGPGDLAFDAEGRLYFSDALAHRVVRMDDLSGAGWTALGGPDPGSGFGQFDEPLSVAVSSQGKILVGDGNNGRVVEVDDLGGAGWHALALPAAAGQTKPRATSVAYDAEGRLYVVDFWSSTLHRFDSIAGDGHVAFTSPGLVQAQHVFVHPSGKIYLAMINGTATVAVMDDMEGTGFTALGTPGDGEKQFRNPCRIVVR